MRLFPQLAIVAASGGLFWATAALSLGRREPWDSPSYWIAYLTGIALCGVFGALLERRAWLWGMVFTFAQVPVMGVLNGVGSLFPLGLVLLAILALPCVGAAALGGFLTGRQRSEA